ncbi:DUF2189 domain-containing protein [Sphingomonas sanxanigenens]|uniref:DUF2189 domain-containing protein n=1 Tax=Sphingomonas sanxanigenens TaxID=397260 RepID=UPI001FDEE78C|nr:DUF2189 domain-containing protein [Sphingomonas sanxanigenens]
MRDALDDFRSKRGDLIFAGLIYPFVGLAAAWLALGNDILPLLFPVAAGISLLGPLAATGFYELARRREAGLEAGWRHFFDIAKNPARDSIAVVGTILIALFGAWLVAAVLIYTAFMGTADPASPGAFLSALFGTANGWAMMIVGNLVGLGFAILAFAISAISLPMLVDRDVGAGPAMRASIEAVRRNPMVMTRWGLTIAVLLVVGSLPFFLGLAVVLPVLGYATWHLYTRVVDREALAAV